VNEAATRNQRTWETCTLPFPKAPARWLSHDHCWPRPIDCTAEGDGEGGLRWLIGATIALRCTRALCALSDSKEGSHGYAPASSCFLEVASRDARRRQLQAGANRLALYQHPCHQPQSKESRL